jgi:tetratricopeptide (TPR) repeat protein
LPGVKRALGLGRRAWIPALVILALVMGYVEYRRDAIVIEPLEAPKPLQDRGYTGRVLATELMDKLNQVGRRAKVSGQHQAFVAGWVGSPLEVEISGARLSLRSIIGFFRNLVGRDPRVVGELVQLDDGRVSLTIRVDDDPERRIAGGLDELDRILLEGAEHLYRSLRAFALAVYYCEFDKPACLDVVKLMLRNQRRDDDPRAYALWGRLLREDGHLKEAADKHQLALAVEPPGVFAGRAEFNRARAFAHNQAGNFYLEHRHQHQVAVEHFNQAIRLQGDYAAPHINIGLTRFREGKLDEAILMYQKALRLDPKHPVAYNNWGAVLLEQGKPQEAVKKFEAAHLLDPEYLFPYTNLATALARLGEEAAALAQFEEARRVMPDNPAVYTRWGNFLRDRKRYAEAEEKYRKALDLDQASSARNAGWASPASAEAYRAWGRLLEQQQRYDEAKEKYEEAVRAHPRDPDTYAYLAGALGRLREEREARATFLKATELNPSADFPWIAWGNFELDRGHLKEAEPKYRKALEVNPWSDSAFSGLGLLEQRRNQWDAAGRHYEKAISIRPGSAGAYNNLGLIHLERGATEKAREHFRKACELGSAEGCENAGR